MINARKLSLRGDTVLWSVIIMLMLASVMVIYSSTGSLAYRERDGNTMYYLLKQVGLFLGCLGVLHIVSKINYRFFSKYAGVCLVIAGVLLLYAAVGGTNINGAGRWVRIPLVGLTFQPSELAKIAIMMYVARLLTFAQTDRYCDDSVLRQFWRPGIVILLIFHDNISTSLLVCLICFLMLVVARVRWKLLGKIVLIVTLAGGLGVGTLLSIPQDSLEKMASGVPMLKRLPTARSRIASFFSDKEGNDDHMFQSNQAKIAVAKGGLMGCGPGNGMARNVLPHSYSDFAYAIIIEEYGLVGGGFIMLLYLIILFRIGVIVRRCTRIYPALLVTGLGLTIVFQSMVNMGVCVGLIPVTGQTLPLISMGGTSLLFTSASFGVILSVSHSFSEDGEVEEEDVNATAGGNPDPEDAGEEYEQGDDKTTNNPSEDDRVVEDEPDRNEKTKGRRRGRRSEPENEPGEDIDMIGDHGLDNMEDELESSGREVLKELRRRGRRGIEQ